MVGNCTAMKAKNARNPTQVCSEKSNNPTSKVTPALSPQVVDDWPESKSGRCLIITGSIVIMMSIIYGVMVWYSDSELRRRVAIVLATAGCTLFFTGFYVYVTFWGESGSGKSQPVMVRVLSCKTWKACQAGESKPDSSVKGADAALPPYDAVYCADNLAFTAEEAASGRSSPLKTGGEKGGNDETRSTCSHPPAYEDINPSFDKHNPA